jgi:EpsI family protein
MATGDNRRILVWQWYRIQGRDGISPYRAKIDLALAKLRGRSDAAAAIIVATPYVEDAKAASATIKDFVTAHKAGLDAQLDQAEK